MSWGLGIRDWGLGKAQCRGNPLWLPFLIPQKIPSKDG